MSAARPVRIGVAGLGRAFAFMLPTFRGDPRVQLVAAADPREAARRQFVADFGGHACESVEVLVRDDAVDVVYVATPHQTMRSTSRWPPRPASTCCARSRWPCRRPNATR